MNNEKKDKNIIDGETRLAYIQGMEIDLTGIKCGRCGCADLRVAKTIRGEDHITRYRVCRHCGRQMRTRERLG